METINLMGGNEVMETSLIYNIEKILEHYNNGVYNTEEAELNIIKTTAEYLKKHLSLNTDSVNYLTLEVKP